MTIKEAIDNIDRLKDNQYSQEDKLGWLADLDGLIYEEIISTHEYDGDEYVPYGTDTDINTTVLLVPAPYTDIYRCYMESRIDLLNGEIAKYNNSISMYNSAYLTFTDYYNRTHMPVQKVTHFTF